MDIVLKYRNEIYGFLALWILLFHIEGSIGMPIHIPLITPFLQKGNSGVDVFMFLSGFCLCLSLKRDFDLKRFYTKRFNRVVISYLIIATPFFVWKSFEEFSTMRVAHFFYDLSGLSFWFHGCQNAWFVEAILLFYVITPLLFLVVRKGWHFAVVCLILMYAINVFAYHFIPIYSLSCIAWSRLPIFFIGIIMAYYVPHFEYKHRNISLLFFVIFGVVLLFVLPGRIGGLYYWSFFGIVVIPLLWILSYIFNRLPETINSVFSSLGNASLEIYVCHIMIWHIFRFYKIEQTLGSWMYLILPAIALPCSFGALHFSKYLIRVNN